MHYVTVSLTLRVGITFQYISLLTAISFTLKQDSEERITV